MDLLRVLNLSIEFGDEYGSVRAVDQLSLSVQTGSILAMVGESGSGKSLTSLAVMGLLPPTARVASGTIEWIDPNQPNPDPEIVDQRLNIVNLLTLSTEQRRQIRARSMAMVFQEPMTALNPVMKCGQQILERVRVVREIDASEKGVGSAPDVGFDVRRLLEEVELTETDRILQSYPHQLSGGQRQRLMLAMALVGQPRLLIADEPTTALDARVQSSLLRLLKRLVRSRGLSMLLVSHDLSLVETLADDVLVLRNGKTMESGPAQNVLNAPGSEYTKALLAGKLRPTQKGNILPVIDEQGRLTHSVHFSSVNGSHESNWISGKGNEDESVGAKNATPEQNPGENAPPAVQINGLTIRYSMPRKLFAGRHYRIALDGVDLSIGQGQTLGLVGESGSGKSTLSRVLVGLQPLWKGEIRLHGQPYHPDRCSPLQRARQVQLVFQDPYSSLNPTQKIGDILAEVVRVHRLRPTEEIPWRVIQLLNSVGLDAEMVGRYPAQLSGGQRQRVVIARALAAEPRILVCDESVSALDVSVRAQILNLLRVLQSTLQLTYLFISHDLSVVYHMSDDIAVLHQGRIVENKPATQLFAQPEHPYTRLLLESMHFGENLSEL